MNPEQIFYEQINGDIEVEFKFEGNEPTKQTEMSQMKWTAPEIEKSKNAQPVSWKEVAEKCLKLFYFNFEIFIADCWLWRFHVGFGFLLLVH